MKKNSTHSKSGSPSLIHSLFMLVVFLTTTLVAQAQSVSTDQLDYAPGSTAIITGTGFQPGEVVELHVHHADGDSLGTDPQYHEPWYVTANAEGNFTTSWYVPTAEEGDALGATLHLEAHGDLGSEAEWTFTDKDNCSTPTIGTQPSNTSVCAGSNASFTVVATATGKGTPTLNYQWQVKDGTGNFANIGTNSTANGTLNLPNVSESMNGNKYRCIVTNNCGDASLYNEKSTNSNEATLVVNVTPNIPGTISGNITVCPGTSSTYSILALSNASTYAWSVPSGWSITGGNGTNTINVTAGSLGQNGNISVTASNSCGTSGSSTLLVAVASSSASISYNDAPYCQSGTASVALTGTSGGLFSGDAGLSITNSGPNAGQIQLGASTSGTHTVAYSIAASGGCSAYSTSTTITINSVPIITCPANIVADNDEGECSASVNFSATATGLPAPSIVYMIGTEEITSPYEFPVGETTVDVIASNLCGTSSCSFTVTVNDNEAPVLSCPANILDYATSAAGKVFNYLAPTVTDNCPGTTTPQLVGGISSGSTFPIGTTIVKYEATDASGNKSQCSFTVTVIGVLPAIVCPDNMNVSASPGVCGTNVTYAVTDPAGIPASAITYSIEPGSFFSLGTTEVTATATNAVGSSSCTFTVTVTDTEAPVISGVDANATIECPATPVFSSPSASDLCGSASITFADVRTEGSCANEYSVIRTWTATDKAGNTSTASQTITVEDNTPPAIIGVGLAATIECPATPVFSSPSASDFCGSSTLTFADVRTEGSCANEYSITRTWTAIDACGNSSTASQTINVEDNTAPSAIAKNIPVILGANSEALINASDINDGSSDACGDVSLSIINGSFDCLNVGENTVTLTVIDACGNSSSVDAIINVQNPAPVVAPLTLTSGSSVIPITNSTVTFNGSFSDNNIKSAYINWDDGDSTDLLAVPFPVSHTYSKTGVNTITLRVTDGCNLVTMVKYEFIVVYDPSGGFVTGGGWINSPAGAYVGNDGNLQNLSLAGKANFGFVSKYLKGANVPIGNTEFQFHVGNLNFKSTSYQWLVVSCTKAQYKGSGKINGSGDYGFLITALDGSPDKFRIKIWDKASSAVVYDNQMNSSEDSNAATDIGGGSIVVHDTKCKTSSSPNARTAGTESTESVQLINELSIESYPNPFKSTLSLKLGNPNNDIVFIQVFDLSGRSLIVKNSQPASDGVYQLDTENLQSGLYILRVKVGSFAKTTKVIKE